MIHHKKCYKKSPIKIIDGVPVFSEHDFYIENYDLISKDHLSHFEKTGLNPFMDENHWKEIENSTESIVRKYIDNRTVKILDVGVGMGRLLERFPDVERYGMDISEGYLNHAKQKGIEVCMSKIEDMPYQDSYFDIVISTDVLEHVLDLNIAIKNLLSPLKIGGILIIRVPYKEDLGPYLREDYPYDLVHLRNFDFYNLKILFEKIFKLHVLEHDFTGYLGGRLKIGGNLMYFNGVVRRLLNIIKIINAKFFFSLSKIFFEPIEIILVVRKVVRPTYATSK